MWRPRYWLSPAGHDHFLLLVRSHHAPAASNVSEIRDTLVRAVWASDHRTEIEIDENVKMAAALYASKVKLREKKTSQFLDYVKNPARDRNTPRPEIDNGSKKEHRFEEPKSAHSVYYNEYLAHHGERSASAAATRKYNQLL